MSNNWGLKEHSRLDSAFALTVCACNFSFSILLSKIITCQTLFIHNIGYLMCWNTLLE